MRVRAHRHPLGDDAGELVLALAQRITSTLLGHVLGDRHRRVRADAAGRRAARSSTSTGDAEHDRQPGEQRRRARRRRVELAVDGDDVRRPVVDEHHAVAVEDAAPGRRLVDDRGPGSGLACELVLAARRGPGGTTAGRTARRRARARRCRRCASRRRGESAVIGRSPAEHAAPVLDVEAHRMRRARPTGLSSARRAGRRRPTTVTSRRRDQLAPGPRPPRGPRRASDADGRGHRRWSARDPPGRRGGSAVWNDPTPSRPGTYTSADRPNGRLQEAVGQEPGRRSRRRAPLGPAGDAGGDGEQEQHVGAPRRTPEAAGARRCGARRRTQRATGGHAGDRTGVTARGAGLAATLHEPQVARGRPAARASTALLRARPPTGLRARRPARPGCRAGTIAAASSPLVTASSPAAHRGPTSTKPTDSGRSGPRRRRCRPRRDARQRTPTDEAGSVTGAPSTGCPTPRPPGRRARRR